MQPVNGVVQSVCGSEGRIARRPEPGSSMSNRASEVLLEPWIVPELLIGNRRLVTVVL